MSGRRVVFRFFLPEVGDLFIREDLIHVILRYFYGVFDFHEFSPRLER